jgi:hypothetical protein
MKTKLTLNERILYWLTGLIAKAAHRVLRDGIVGLSHSDCHYLPGNSWARVTVRVHDPKRPPFDIDLVTGTVATADRRAIVKYLKEVAELYDGPGVDECSTEVREAQKHVIEVCARDIETMDKDTLP